MLKNICILILLIFGLVTPVGPIGFIWLIYNLIKKKSVLKPIKCIIICGGLYYLSFIIYVIGSLTSDSFDRSYEVAQEQAEYKENVSADIGEGVIVTIEPTPESTPITTPKPSEYQVELDEYNSGEYHYITLSDLNQYHANMAGVKILCVITVNDLGDKTIQSNLTDKVMMSSFYTVKEYKNIKKNNRIAIIGIVDDYTDYGFLGKILKFRNCMVIAKGTDAEQFDLGVSAPELQEYFTVTADTAKSGVKLTEEEYKGLCQKLSHNDILRNPDTYYGNYCVVSGKVDQIIEGFFDSCTIYVKDANGNKWHCYYSYADGETRVLEGDRITVYGICKGTSNSTTVLGKQVTFPDIDVEYIDFN